MKELLERSTYHLHRRIGEEKAFSKSSFIARAYSNHKIVFAKQEYELQDQIKLSGIGCKHSFRVLRERDGADEFKSYVNSAVSRLHYHKRELLNSSYASDKVYLKDAFCFIFKYLSSLNSFICKEENSSLTFRKKILENLDGMKMMII